jgi:hypothetical protein
VEEIGLQEAERLKDTWFLAFDEERGVPFLLRFPARGGHDYFEPFSMALHSPTDVELASPTVLRLGPGESRAGTAVSSPGGWSAGWKAAASAAAVLASLAGLLGYRACCARAR